MRFVHSIDISANLADVWAVVGDVGRWPELTASISTVEFLGADRLGPGAQARIKQPRFPEMVWAVTQWAPGESFVWETSRPGVHTVASHMVEALGPSQSRLTLSIDQRGVLAGLLGLLSARITRRYLRLEAEGMKRAAEAPVLAAKGA